MTLRPGTLHPLLEIDGAVGIIGFILAVCWGKVAGRTMDRDTIWFLGKMFGGIMLVFLVIILLNL